MIDTSEETVDKETDQILLILQEECAEVIQAISKCFRFGMGETHPNTGISNIDSLTQELGDLLAMIELLVDRNIGITDEVMREAKLKKFLKLKRWSTLTIAK